jgi:riboflavin biosynthesis pyrimidine reductase
MQMMRSLRAEGIRSVLCEGGGRLGSDLVASGLVDRLYLIVAPRFLGKGGVPAFSLPSSGGDGVRGPSWAHWVPGEAPRMLGRDLWVALKREAS